MRAVSGTCSRSRFTPCSKASTASSAETPSHGAAEAWALRPKKVTPTDQAMADLVSAYWVSFGLTTDPNGGGRPLWPRHDREVDRLMHFTNSGVIVGTDPLKPRLDLWQRVWTRDR
jgi:carboxylesterase type B